MKGGAAAFRGGSTHCFARPPNALGRHRNPHDHDLATDLRKHKDPLDDLARHSVGRYTFLLSFGCRRSRELRGCRR